MISDLQENIEVISRTLFLYSPDIPETCHYLIINIRTLTLMLAVMSQGVQAGLTTFARMKGDEKMTTNACIICYYSRLKVSQFITSCPVQITRFEYRLL